MSYRLLGHTADLRARVDGEDETGLYQSALDLVRHIAVGDSPIAARQVRRLEIDGSDGQERFFRFVRELVYLVDSEGFLPRRVRLGPPIEIEGELFDPARHRVEHQLKAVTRHGYELASDESGYRAELVFDL